MSIKSLKTYFEQVEKQKITETDLALPILGKDGKSVSTQPGFIKLQGDNSPADKAMQAALKDMVAKKQIQVVAPIDPKQQAAAQQKQQQQQQQQKPTTGQPAPTGTPMKEEMIDEKAPPGMEKFIKDRKPAFKEKYGKRWEEVLYATAWKQYNKAKNEGVIPFQEPQKSQDKAPVERPEKQRERVPLKVPFEAAEDNPPPPADTGEMLEAEIPSSGPDYGAGLGAGRSDKVLEAKPDFLDLDNDGNKKEAMKSAAKDAKKKKVKESMNTLEAAYHEGKAHGLSKHSYACRYNEGSEEHKRYHDGFKEGLDECYGLQPNRGLVVSEVDEVPATVPGMADQAEKEMGEGNAFTAALAKADKGEKFSVGGKTFTDRSNYDAKIDEFAFESLDKQLNSLLESEETVQEGLSVNMSKGMGGMGEDTVSVSANGDDASKLIDFIKQVGLGGLGADKAEVVGASEPVVAVASDYGAPKFSGHDGMKDLMAKVTGGEDYKDEEGHDHAEEAKPCNECGMSEGCGCEKKEAVMGEEETPDQMTDEMAEDSAGADEVAMTTADEDAEAAEDKTKPAFGGATNEDANSEASGGAASGVEAGDEAEEAEETMSESKFVSLFKKLSMLSEESTEEKDEKAEKAGEEVKKDIEYDDKKDKEEKLDEWANDAGKKGTDATFERDIEFMTKVIAGGLNKPKATGQTTIPVIASQDARNGDEDVSAWKKLAGLGK